MNKKLIPLILASNLMHNVVFAENLEDTLFIKGGVGLNQINNTKFSNHKYEGKNKLSNKFPLIELGIGCNLNETIRTELVLDYYFMFRSNETSTTSNQDIYRISSKTKANTLMTNIYKDIITINNITPFIGGGVGIVSLTESANGYAISNDDNIYYPLDNEFNNKTTYQLAYKLTGGIGYKIAENINGEVSYNYFNLGNNKKKNIGGIDNISKRAYSIHNITLGLRFNI